MVVVVHVLVDGLVAGRQERAKPRIQREVLLILTAVAILCARVCVCYLVLIS